MNSVFNDSASESKIEQALAECAALTRANDPLRALNAGRMIETAHLGQPRVLARVARMYSDLGMQEESARVLRGLHSAVRPSSVVPARHAFADSDELPSYGEDDNEPTQAKSFEEIAGSLPGVPTLLASVPPPPVRSSAPPVSGKSSSTSHVPPPPPRGAAPGPITSSAPPPPPRGAAPGPITSSASPAAPSSSLPPLPGSALASSVPPPPPGARPTTSVPPPPGRPQFAASQAPPPVKAASVAPPPRAFPAAGLQLPPPPGRDEPDIAATAARGEWDFDDDDDEPTRAFTPHLVSGQRSPGTAPRGAAPATTDDGGWRDRMHVLRAKTIDSFEQLKRKSGAQLEQLKQKSSDQLRRISSRPPPAARAAAAPVAAGPAEVSTDLPAFSGRRSSLASARNKLLAVLLVAGVGIFFWHRQTRQHQDALENELTQARPLLWSSDRADIQKISKHLDRSFEPTTYAGIANSVAESLGLSDDPVFPSLEGEAHVLELRQYAVLRLVDPKTDPKELETLIDRAKKSGALPERLRFAKLLSVLDAAPGDAPDEELDDALKKDPIALLLSGISLEREGKVQEAAKRYGVASSQEAEWYLPRVYAARLALLTRGAEGAKPQLDKLREDARVDPNLGVISRALNALSWVVDPARSREVPDTAKLADAEEAQLPPVLAPVPMVVKLVTAMHDESDQLKTLLADAIQRADGPPLLVQLAGFAAAVNQGDLVDDAIERVQQFAKGYAPAIALAARMQLSKGDFAAARQTAKAAGLDASGIDAVEAYENQDAKNMAKALEAMPEEEKKKPEYEAIVVARDILSGESFPSAATLDQFMKDNALWGQLIAVDAALDQGDLTRARAIIKEWAENERTVLHQIRVARYERYSGRTHDAVQLSKKALEQASTSSRALIEYLSALLADDQLEAAIKLFSDALYKDMLKPHERWVDALLIGKDKGWMAANVVTSYLQPPTSSEALGLRLLALRAMCVAGDPRAGVYLKRLGKEVPENPDYLLSKSEY